MPAFAFLKVLPTQWHRLLQAFLSVVCCKLIGTKQQWEVVQQRCREAHRQGSCQRGYRHCCLQGNFLRVLRFGSLNNCDIQESAAKIPLLLSCLIPGRWWPSTALRLKRLTQGKRCSKKSVFLSACLQWWVPWFKSQLINLKALICRIGIWCYLIEQEDGISNPWEF